MNTSFLLSALGLATGLLAATAQAQTATFDDLALAPNSHYFPNATTSFSSGPASFNHDYTDYGFAGCCWNGWTYSNETDTTTAGYTNQYSAITGGGAQGSANYGVAYFGSPAVSFAAPVSALGVYLTNTTYAALSMRDGDSFAKKFGGATGNDADYLKLTITGLNAQAQATGSVEFFLADFRFADNSQDYIVDTWRYVDLSPLGTVSSLRFDLASSDTSSFGINTPVYFAMDSLSVSAVPEPNSLVLMWTGVAMMALGCRRVQSRQAQA